METGIIRPVSPIAEAMPATPRADPVSGAATELASSLTVRSGEQSQLGSKDSRRQEFDDRAEITTSDAIRKALAFDDATHLPVVRKIKAPDTVIDQIPSEAYLRMRVALQEALEASHPSGNDVDRSA